MNRANEAVVTPAGGRPRPGRRRRRRGVLGGEPDCCRPRRRRPRVPHPRGGRDLITVDHTVATELEIAGLRPDDVPDASGAWPRCPASSASDAWRAFSVRMLDIRGGDRLVMCSDGVHRHVSVDVWRAATATSSCQDLVDHLVTSVRRARGPDDATALALRLGGVP